MQESAGGRTREPSPSSLRILIADSDLLVSQSLAMALWWWPGLEPLNDFPVSGPATVDAIKLKKPHVTLVDYWIPLMTGPAVCTATQHRSPEAKIIVTAGRHGASEIDECLSAGASAFLSKGSTVEETVEVIRRVNSGEPAVVATQNRNRANELRERESEVKQMRQRLASLTAREIELVRLLDAGFSTLEMAAALSIAPTTVRDHFHNIVVKTKAKSKEHAAAMARVSGMIKS